MASKYAIYAVAYGIHPLSHEPIRDYKFGTWKECSEYISGVEGANYKGFYTNSEADAWLAAQDGQPRGKKKRSTEYTQKPSVTEKTKSSNVLSRSKGEIKSRFAEKCVKLNVEPNAVVYYLMEQWLNMTNFIHVAEELPFDDEDEDDDIPW